MALYLAYDDKLGLEAIGIFAAQAVNQLCLLIMYALVIERNDWEKSAEEARERRLAENPDHEYLAMSQEDEEEQMV